MNRPQVFLKYKINLSKNMRFSCLKDTNFSDQPLASPTLNASLIFYIFLLLFYYETTPNDHTNNCYWTFIISSHFSWLFCTVCQKKLSASTEPEERTWPLAANTNILLVRSSDVIWLQRAIKAKTEQICQAFPLNWQFLTLATIVFFQYTCRFLPFSPFKHRNWGEDPSITILL